MPRKNAMKLSIHSVDLPLLHPFTIARGTKYAAKNVVLILEGDFGIAYGECAPNPRYNQSQDGASVHYHQLKKEIEVVDVKDLSAIEHFYRKNYPKGGAYAAGVEMLLLDAHGKAYNKPLWKLLGCSTPTTAASTYTIGISGLEELEGKLKEAAAFPILKVKLGGENDLAMMAKIREYTDKPIRIDANEGWKDPVYALKMAEKMVEFGVELIEQPLAASDRKGLVAFRKESPLPVCADESCEGQEDLNYLAEAFDIINIKLMKIGSVLGGLKLSRDAQAKGLEVMVGCMLESSLAIAAGALIGTTAKYADLDGHVLIKDMPFSKLQTNEEFAITLSDLPGLGVQMESSLAKYELV